MVGPGASRLQRLVAVGVDLGHECSSEVLLGGARGIGSVVGQNVERGQLREVEGAVIASTRISI